MRGSNTIHILSDGQCRVAHPGDLGCELAPDQKDKLRHLTALLIPVADIVPSTPPRRSGIAKNKRR